jgi:ribosomal protein S27E
MSSTKTASYLISNNANFSTSIGGPAVSSTSSSSSSSSAFGYNLNQGNNLSRSLMTPSPLSVIQQQQHHHSNYGDNIGANTSLMNSIAENIQQNHQNQYDVSSTYVNGYNKFLSTSPSSFSPHLLYSNGISQVNNLNVLKSNNNNNNHNLSPHMNNNHHHHHHNHHHSHHLQQQQQQCGICHKEPMFNGKTLIGCLHSFCQSCLVQSQTFLNNNNNSNSHSSSYITCPICYQETLMPNGGIDALMPHYSNPILINDLLDETTTTSTTTINSNHLLKSHSNSNGYQNFSTANTPTTTSSNGLLDLSLLSSSVVVVASNDDMVKHKRFAQQQLNYKKLVYEQQQRLIKIENDINKAYSYCVQALNERRDNLVKEFQAIVQFVHKQNQNKLLLSSSGGGGGGGGGNDVDTDSNASSKIVATKSGKKLLVNASNGGEKLINNGGDFQEANSNSFFDTSNCVSPSVENDLNSSNSNEMQSLINTHLMAIEFVSNYANIQAAVRNSFGYIR